MRIEGSEVTTLITGVVVLFSALAASSNKFNKFIQRTVKSVTIVCQENNEVVRNYSKDESRSLVIG